MPPKYLTGHAIQGSNIEKKKQKTNNFTTSDRRFNIQMATFTRPSNWWSRWCSKPTVEAIQNPRDPSMTIFSLPASERVMPETSDV
jgi:hypothetical protein